MNDLNDIYVQLEQITTALTHQFADNPKVDVALQLLLKAQQAIQAAKENAE